MSFRGCGLRWGNSTLSTAIVLGDWAWRLQQTFLRLARVSLKTRDWLDGKLWELTLLVFCMNAWTLPDSALPHYQVVTFVIERFVVQRCSKYIPKFSARPKASSVAWASWLRHCADESCSCNSLPEVGLKPKFLYWNHDKRGGCRLWLYSNVILFLYFKQKGAEIWAHSLSRKAESLEPEHCKCPMLPPSVGQLGRMLRLGRVLWCVASTV